MRLVAASRVLNEADIIEAFVRHTAFFVDHHVFVDNGSTDGTLGILQSLRNEGIPLTIYQSRARSFVETRLNTFLYQTAVSEHQADWVLHLDVDEFIDDRALVAPLRDCLDRFRTRHGADTCMVVPLREFWLTQQTDPNELLVTRRITHSSPQLSGTLKVIVPASLARRQAVVQAGNHSVRIDDKADCPVSIEPTLSYAHYSTRSTYQWMSKNIIGWAKILASGEQAIRSGLSIHYKEPFERLRDDAASILRDPGTMRAPKPPDDLVVGPINYRGGALKFTQQTDYAIRAFQVVMRYLEDIATQHGDMLEHAIELSALMRRTETGLIRLV